MERTPTQLLAHNQLLQIVAEQIPGIVWTTDTDLRFTSSLGAGLAALGLKPNEINGMPLVQYFGAPDESFPPLAAHRAALRGEAVPYEYVWQGRSYQATVRSLRSPDRQTIVGVAGVALDVTDMRSLEAKLRQSQKMDAVGRLAGGMAHEFNNLLTVVLGYCEILLGGAKLDKGTRKHVEEIKLAADQGAIIARRLLSFSRTQPSQRQPLNLNRAVASMDKLLRRVIGEDIDLISVQDLRLGLVLADPADIEQAITNLATNARDAMPKGGRLTIESKNVDLEQPEGDLPAGAYVTLSVTDTGIGMDEATLKRMFEPFFTTKPQDDAPGLGLMTVDRIVGECGGRVAVTSKPGAGSTFRIWLPRIGDAEPAPSGAPGSCTETVLVVEDQSHVRCMERDALVARGYKVIEAGDGEEALRVAEWHRGTIDLLVTDVLLPGLSGGDVRARLAEKRPKMRALYVSGHADPAKHGHLRPFLQKPFTPETFAAKVREVLDA